MPIWSHDRHGGSNDGSAINLFHVPAWAAPIRAVLASDAPLATAGLIAESFCPGPFDPIETWEQFLAEVQAMPDLPFQEYAIETTKRTIEQIRQHLRARRHGVDWVH